MSCFSRWFSILFTVFNFLYGEVRVWYIIFADLGFILGWNEYCIGAQCYFFVDPASLFFENNINFLWSPIAYAWDNFNAFAALSIPRFEIKNKQTWNIFFSIYSSYEKVLQNSLNSVYSPLSSSLRNFNLTKIFYTSSNFSKFLLLTLL